MFSTASECEGAEHIITSRVEDRIQAVSEFDHLSKDEARKHIEVIDKFRADYYGALFLLKNAVEGKLIHMQTADCLLKRQ